MEDPTLWIVKLSNNTELNSSNLTWQQLHSHIKKDNLAIVQMQLRFRDHVVSMPDNAKGYFFGKGCVGDLSGGKTFNFFITGVLLPNDMVERIWFYVPELEVYQKDIKHKSKISQGLIINENSKDTISR
jgi:hypothetical protein